MHYYKRNLGDYAKKAGRLSMLQHGSYTLLIDACYDREQFPTLEEAIEWTWASTTEEIEAVTFVLRKFFTLENGVYVQKRIQEEIEEYHGKAQKNKLIAVERETKRKENTTKRVKNSTNRERDVNEPPPNQEPRTNNHKPEEDEEPSAKVIPLEIASPPPPQPFNYSSQKFSMHPEWEPSEQFEILARLAGMPLGDQYPVDEFLEFRTYWVVHPERQMTQGEWEHKFIENCKFKKSKGYG